MSHTFEDKVVLVTGASRGIGAAILKEFAEKGAYVVGTATTEQGAQGIASVLEGSGFQGMGHVLNLGENAKESIAQLQKSLDAQGKVVQILVNNAGITGDNLVLRMKESQWDSIIQTNLTGVFLLTKALLKPMIKSRWGRVVNLSSVVASTGNPGQTNYAASKAGLIGFSKSLAQEIGNRGITVNVVSPGFIDTDMTKGLPEAQKEHLLSQISLGRLGQAKEIAHAVCFLASDQAAYITGETLHVNGGMYCP